MKRYILLLLLVLSSCEQRSNPKSATGVSKAQASVKPQANGLTVEQENIKRRIELENTPGSIKHIYILSAYSGEVLLYSTVKGKITSSGKRLTPSTINGGFDIKFPGYHDGNPGISADKRDWTTTSEVLQDDGTYGSSIEYLYWFDQSNVYHQHYLQGGQILHISGEPMVFGKVTQTVEVK